MKESNQYEFENLYQVVEFYIKDGETIPNKYDIIEIEQHDEICSIEYNVKIIEFIKKEIKFDNLYVIAKCEIQK